MNKRLLSMFLALCMVVTMLPIPAMAEEANMTIGGSGGIINFAPLAETEKTVALGTSIEDLELPETLTATVRTAPASAMHEGANQQTVADKVYSSEWKESMIDAPVTSWASQPEYDMDTVGVYVFTPLIEGYTVSTELPEIKVTVGAVRRMILLSTTEAVTLKVDDEATDDNAIRSNGAKYKTFAGAYAAALSGDTIQFVRASTIDSLIKIEKNITIDLNGSEVTQTGALQVMNAELTIKDSSGGGTITCVNDRGFVTVFEDGSFILESGMIQGSNLQYSTVNLQRTNSKFTMTGGTISSPAQTALYVGGATANILGGTITTETGVALDNFGGKTTISGGTITATKPTGRALSGFGYVYIGAGDSLTGQTIEVNEASQFWLTDGALTNVTVTGTNANLNCFLAPGATFNQNDVVGTETTYSGTLTAKLADVAEVDDVKFGILQQAFDSAATGITEEERTVTLLQNIDMGKATTKITSGDIILDFGEYTITSSKNSNGASDVLIYIPSGNFTCKATIGGITAPGTSPLYFSSSGNLTIHGGTFSGKPIYASRNSGNLGDITINNGTFDGFLVSNRNSLTINDGIFKASANVWALRVAETPVVIHGGTFESTSIDTVSFWKSQATIKGGTFSCASSTNNVLYVLGDKVCIIEDGTFNSPKIWIYTTANALKLQGGSFTSGIEVVNDTNTNPKATLANILQSGYGYVDGSGNRVSVGGDSYNGNLQVQRVYSITGTIKGSDTGANGLAGATVQLKNGASNAGSSVTTNASGSFTITGVPNGNYTIEVSKSGYTPGTISEFAVSENITGKDLTLQKIYTPITAVSVSNASPKVGDTLIAITAPTNATVSYQWKAGGAEINGATNMFYTVHESDVGKAITVTATGSGAFNGSITSNLTAAVVKKAAPSAPGAPTLVSKMHNTVTLTANAAYEFSKDGSIWQISNVFSGLTASTAYTFYQRVAETADTEESAASAGFSVTTDTTPVNALTGTATISNTAPRIGNRLTGLLVGGNNTGALTYVWKAGGTQINIGSEYIVAATDLGKTITLEITSNVQSGTVTSTETTAVAKKVAPAVPSAPTLSSKTYNSVTLTANAGYSFSKDGSTWQTGNVFTGLTANTAYIFYQKVAETADTEESAASASLSVTTNSNSSGGDGGGSGGGRYSDKDSSSDSSGSSANNSSLVIVTPPAPDKPDSPTQGEIKVDGKVDENGNATVNITDKNVTDVFDKAMEDAKKNGNEQNGITLVLHVNTGGKTFSNVTVNLPKTVQDIIISKRIVNTILLVDNPDIRIGMDLPTVEEIKRQASSDVNVTAARIDSGKLTGDAKRAIGNRPVFDLKVNYGSGKQVQSFGAGNVSVTIPYILGANERAENVCAVYIDGNGKVHWLVSSVYDSVGKVLRFSTNHFSTYGVGYKEETPAFTDIASHWAKEDIEFVASRDLLRGTSETTFSPNTAMTRGMFVTALGRLANADVKANSDYMGYIEWAKENGIVSGTTDGKFLPDASITREQMAVIMSNYAKVIGFTLPKVHEENTFADSAKISAYAKDAVEQMQLAGVLNGKNGNLFDPQGTATSAEVSAVLRRFVELAISSDTM